MNRETRQKHLIRCREAITGKIWAQWNCLGVDGFSDTDWQPEWAIDPEALILASSRLFTFEPRLKESVISWLLQNGEFISIARLKRIQKEHSIGDSEAMADLAAHLLELNPNSLSWKGIEAWNETPKVTEAKPTVRELARNFSPERPSNIILKLRALFGVTSRVEILFQLSYWERSPIRKLAKETAWSLQTVQKTLRELLASGHVYSEKGDWPSAHYFLRREDWKSFFPHQYEKEFYLNQFSLYRGLFLALDAFGKAANSKDDEYALFILKEGLTESFSPIMQARNSLLAAFETSEQPNTVSAIAERFVTTMESETDWPTGAFLYKPDLARLR